MDEVPKNMLGKGFLLLTRALCTGQKRGIENISVKCDFCLKIQMEEGKKVRKGQLWYLTGRSLKEDFDVGRCFVDSALCRQARDVRLFRFMTAKRDILALW